MGRLTLTQIARIIKSEATLIVLAIISIGLFTLGIFAIIQREPEKIQIASGQVPWQDQILAGKSTSYELESKLGKPIKIQTQDKRSSYFYPSGSQQRFNEIEIDQNVIQLIKEQVVANEKGNLNDFLVKFGQPEKILYGKHGIAAPAYFWGEKGIVVFGNPTSGLIVEIWYFKPITLMVFLQKYPEFQLTPKEIP